MRRFFTFLLSLLTVVLLLTGCGEKTPVYGMTVENPYPDLPTAPLASFLPIYTFEHDLQTTSAIFMMRIDGELVKETAATETPLTPGETDEHPNHKAKFYTWQVTIVDVLFGETEVEGKQMTFRKNASLAVNIPAFEVGKEYLVMGLFDMKKNTCNGGNEESYYYITEDDTVFPATKKAAYAKFNNMPLDLFIDYVENAVANKKNFDVWAAAAEAEAAEKELAALKAQ